jgi:hypothetical protein
MHEIRLYKRAIDFMHCFVVVNELARKPNEPACELSESS